MGSVVSLLGDGPFVVDVVVGTQVWGLPGIEVSEDLEAHSDTDIDSATDIQVQDLPDIEILEDPEEAHLDIDSVIGIRSLDHPDIEADLGEGHPGIEADLGEGHPGIDILDDLEVGRLDNIHRPVVVVDLDGILGQDIQILLQNPTIHTAVRSVGSLPLVSARQMLHPTRSAAAQRNHGDDGGGATLRRVCSATASEWGEGRLVR